MTYPTESVLAMCGRSALHPRLPPKLIPLPMMWVALEEMGVGAVAIPAGEETGALPRTPSRPYGRLCLPHDQSSIDLPIAPLVSERLCPRPTHLPLRMRHW